jgi:hypothetical protein
MAFALSVEAAKMFGEAGKVMMTSTFIVILITVLINGGSTAYLLDWCGLAQGSVTEQVSAAGNQQQQQKSAEMQQQQEEEDEQVQLLLHRELQEKLEERGKLAAGQLAGPLGDFKLTAAGDEAKQQQQHAGKPVLVGEAFSEEAAEAAAGLGHCSTGLQSAAVGTARAEHPARVASPAVLLQDDCDTLAAAAAAAHARNLRRRSSGNGCSAATSSATGASSVMLGAVLLCSCCSAHALTCSA